MKISQRSQLPLKRGSLPQSAPLKNLPAVATQIRRDILEISYRARTGHVGSAFSIVDILVALYNGFLRFPLERPDHPDRDRFLLSKGHAVLALYVALAHRGFFRKEKLNEFVQDGSELAGHPEIQCVPGVEISSGSLGHGLSLGAGMAFAARLDKRPTRAVVLLSDGECNEGSIWEAIHFAGHHKLANLTAIVDYNKSQALGRTKDVLDLEPFAAKWQSFGWAVAEVDGHDHQKMTALFKTLPLEKDKPSVIIAHTVMGKGVSFMEGDWTWHYHTPTEQHFNKGLEELNA